MLIGAWEWARLSDLQSLLQRSLYVFSIAILLLLAWYSLEQVPEILIYVLGLAGLWWLYAWIAVLQYKGSAGSNQDGGGYPPFARFLIGIIILVAPYIALVYLHYSPAQGPQLVLFLLILVWVADSGAYFSGRKWGRRKLAPSVSPGKTWEGVIGAFAASLVTSLLAGLFFGMSRTQLLVFICLSLVVVVFSILGDLTISLFKRATGIKDSGHILPGHGGMLDRIDSLTAAAPIFVLALILMSFLP